MLPREQRGGRPDTRVMLASTITIQLSTPTLFTHTIHTCYASVVAGADIITTGTTPAPRQSVSLNNLI